MVDMWKVCIFVWGQIWNWVSDSYKKKVKDINDDDGDDDFKDDKRKRYPWSGVNNVNVDDDDDDYD